MKNYIYLWKEDEYKTLKDISIAAGVPDHYAKNYFRDNKKLKGFFIIKKQLIAPKPIDNIDIGELSIKTGYSYQRLFYLKKYQPVIFFWLEENKDHYDKLTDLISRKLTYLYYNFREENKITLKSIFSLFAAGEYKDVKTFTKSLVFVFTGTINSPIVFFKFYNIIKRIEIEYEEITEEKMRQ